MTNSYIFNNIEPQYKLFLSKSSLSKNTINNYLSDIRHFLGWTKTQDKANIDGDTVNKYLQYLNASKLPRSTVQRRIVTLKNFTVFLNQETEFKLNLSDLVLNKKYIYKNKSTNINGLNIPNDTIYKPSNKHNILFTIVFFILVLSAGLTSYLSFYKITESNRDTINIKKTPDGRTLVYTGIIKDSLGNKIDTKTDISFHLYSASTAQQPIYTGQCKGQSAIQPDISGKIKVTIGKDCGMNPIPTDIFWKETALYLGIKVGSDKEISPRTQIPNASFSLNSEQLQGLSIGQNDNSIPYINDRGTIILGSEEPTVYSSSEESPLTIESGQNLILKSGFNSNLEFEAQQSGNILFKAGGDDQEATQMYISNYGNVGIGSLSPEDYKLQVAGDIGPDSDSIYDLGSKTGQWANIFSNAFFQNGVPLCDKEGNNCPINNTWINSKPYIYQNDTSQKIGIGTDSIKDIESQLYVTRDMLKGPTGKALAIFNQTENQDIFTASSSGTLKFVIKNNGNTGVGTINPSAKLDVSGGQTKIEISTQYSEKLCHSGMDLDITQNVTLGGCSSNAADIAEYYGSDDKSIEAGDLVSIGKAGIIDDKSSKAYIKKSTIYDTNLLGVVSTNPYDSFGNNFSQNEYKVPVALAGRVPIKVSMSSKDIKTGDPLTISDDPGLAKKSEKSGQIIGYALNNWSSDSGTTRLLAFIRPGWHDIESYIDSGGEISNKIKMKTNSDYVYEGRETESNDFNKTSLFKDIKNFIVSRIYVQERLFSPIIETEKLIASGEAIVGQLKTTGISSNNNDLIIDIGKNKINDTSSSDSAKLTEIIISGLEGMRAASIDSIGNATFSGKIKGNDILTNNIRSGNISSDNIHSDDIYTNSATVAGILRADKIESSTISQLNNKIDSIDSSTSGYIKSLKTQNDLALEKLNTTVNELQSVLGQLKNESLPNTAAYTNILNSQTNVSDLNTSIQEIAHYTNPQEIANEETTIEKLNVIQLANFYNTNVTGTLTAGSIVIENNSILSLAWDLNFSSLGNISFFDGAVKIAKNGTIITNGNIIAKAGITTNGINSLNNDLTIKLDGTDNSAQNTDVKRSVIIANASGNTVGSINEDGVASFNGLTLDSFTDNIETKIISASDNLNKIGDYSPGFNTTNKTAGKGVIPANSANVILYNQKLSDNSLIYLTPTDEITDIQLSVVKKEICSDSTPTKTTSCDKYFKIAASNSSHPEIHFNWLIIN